MSCHVREQCRNNEKLSCNRLRTINSSNERDIEWHWHLEASARRLLCHVVVLYDEPTEMFV
jgi:hypothetical protein